MYFRYRILPYIIEQARLGGALGLPLVRAMILECPQDRNVWYIETQYFFGSDLLVAPILRPLEDSLKHHIYFPVGTWYDFWTKERIESRGEWVEVDAAPLELMPIWVREGAMILWAEKRLRTFNKAGKIERVDIYGVREGSWSCGDGEGGLVEVVERDGKFICLDRDDVVVERYV